MSACRLFSKIDGLIALAATCLALAAFPGCQQRAENSQAVGAGTSPTQSTSQPASSVSPSAAPSPPAPKKQFAGSKTCYDCHAKFYDLWATSRHGLAMQTYSPAFAKKELQPQKDDVVIGRQSFRAEIGEKQGWVRERTAEKDGSTKEVRYPIVHVLGGKNSYYFLTQMAKGRLQVLPVAYNVKKKSWYDEPASGVRHFSTPGLHDEALPWTDRLFTFNSTCFDCHVSQLATNYDLKTDTYHTTWREAGISCESCHGPGGEHIQAMEEGVKGHTSKDIKIVRTLEFSHAQLNDMCATCHAKLVPFSTDFASGDRFYDHFDLLTLEHQEFYPDGRDLGENYTFTSWSMSPCLKSGKLDCSQCHTGAGRPKYEGKLVNQSCMPCHSSIVENSAAHSHHKTGSAGDSCIACHMPMSQFAAMMRTDHSMRPPMPAATIAFKSPNACNQCHDKKDEKKDAKQDAAWADGWVRKWYPRDYQAAPRRRAALLDAARKDQWQRLPEMLAEIESPECDEVYRNSFVRLVRNCNDPRKWPVLIAALKDESPLVRASAASALEGYLTEESVPALLRAAADPLRLVRIRAATALAPLPPERIADENQRRALRHATGEFREAMAARADDWASYANLGSFEMDRGDFEASAEAYETALKIEPRAVGPMVSVSMAYANLKRRDKAEAWLRRAVKTEPENAAANFNLGLLLMDTERLDEAEKAMRAALKADPQLAAAAYNLGEILADKHDLPGALEWFRKAHELRPDDLKYTQTLAVYSFAKGDKDAAISLLKRAIRDNPKFLGGYETLAEMYERGGQAKEAARMLRDGLKQPGLPPQKRSEWEAHAEKLEGQ